VARRRAAPDGPGAFPRSGTGPCGPGPVTEADVFVWTVRVDEEVDRLERLDALLAPGERERAGRFHAERHRRQFVVTRGVLRTLIGRRLGIAPAFVRFVEGPHGKPALADPSTPALEFNVAHSHGLALVALSAGAPVGIDVERIRPGVDHEGIAGRFFAQVERTALARIEPARRIEAFFACWSRKEAVLKAVGTGISGGVAAYAVSCDPDGPARLLATGPDGPPLDRWTLADLDVGPGFRAAVAVVRPAARILQVAEDAGPS